MGMVSRFAKKKAKKEAKAEAARLLEEANDAYCRKMDGLWLYTLHTVFGFGKVDPNIHATQIPHDVDHASGNGEDVGIAGGSLLTGGVDISHTVIGELNL